MEEEIKRLYLEEGLEDKEISDLLQIKKWRVVKITKNLHRNKEQISNKRRKTNLSKYGVENVSQSHEIKEKKKQTCMSNFGVENPQQNINIIEKTQQTFNTKYNGNPLCKKSDLFSVVKNGLIKKTGFDNPMKNKDIAKKTSKKLKALQPEIIRKNREKYGVDYLCQLPEIRKKISTGVIKALPKMYETRTKNGTHASSKAEEYIFELIVQIFPNSKHLYYSERYPFNCDFYIPCLDLYIEYQGFEGHGGRPFMQTEEDLRVVERWKQKSTEINFKGEYKRKYLNYIETWTIRDVRKRNWAKEHKLNWLEFFNMEEFLIWWNNLLTMMEKD